MKHFLVIVLIFSPCAIAEQEFGFVYSWGLIHSYNSFNHTYTRSICRDAQVFYSEFELEKSTLNSIQSKLNEMDFWNIEDDKLVSYGPGDGEITIVAPCGDKKLFSQLGVQSNFVWASCGGFPNSAKKLGEAFISIGAIIENSVSKHRSYKRAPESKCSFY